MSFSEYLKEKFTLHNYFDFQLFLSKNIFEEIDDSRIENFVLDLKENIEHTIKDIVSSSYNFFPFKSVYLADKNDKLRKFSLLEGLDKFLDKLCHEFIKMSNLDYKRLGIHLITSKIYESMKRGNIYFIKSDIKDFFPKIDHHILIQKIKQINDNQFEKLIFSFIKTPSLTDEDIFILKQKYGNHWIKNIQDINKNGLPIGAATSQALSDFYLKEFDRLITDFASSTGSDYFRYADDICFLSSDSRVIDKAMDLIKNNLAKIKLELNESKIIISSLRKANNSLTDGLNYLGFNYNLDNKNQLIISVSDKTLKNIKSTIIKFYKRKLKFIIENEKTDFTVLEKPGFRFWLKLSLSINCSIRGFHPEWYNKSQLFFECYGLARFLSIINNYKQVMELEKWIGKVNKYYCFKICDITKKPRMLVDIVSLTNWFFRYKKNLKKSVYSAYYEYYDSIIESLPMRPKPYEKKIKLLQKEIDRLTLDTFEYIDLWGINYYVS